MITTRCLIDKDLVLKEVTVEGHSGFAKKGSDIICAAVSILIHALHLGCLAVPGIDVTINNSSRYSIRIDTVADDVRGEARGITIILIEGLQSLADQYQDHVKLEIDRS